MAKRLFIERQNGQVVRERHRFSGHGGSRPNRTLRIEERAERHEALLQRDGLLSEVEVDELHSPSAADESCGGPYALGAQIWDYLEVKFDDGLGLSASFDQTTGQMSFASCGRRSRRRRRRSVK